MTDKQPPKSPKDCALNPNTCIGDVCEGCKRFIPKSIEDRVREIPNEL